MFTVQAILRQVPITYRQLDSWARDGVIHPIRNGGGQGVGSERMFLGDDFRHALWTARLVKAGVELHTAARIAYKYVSTMPHPALSGYMVEMGPGIHMYLTNEGDFNREYQRLEREAVGDEECFSLGLDQGTEGSEAVGRGPEAASAGGSHDGDHPRNS